MGIIERLDSRSEKHPITISLLCTLTIGLIDYWTGLEFRMEIFYLAPISYATWFSGKKTGFAVSVLSLIAILCSDILSGKNYYNLYIEIWNGAMYLGFFVVVSLLLSKLRAILQQRADLITELQSALSKVKELSGILPICANCKKIRDDEGYWQDVAVYISKHTNAEFSHGICKECAAKLYPGYYKKKETE
jgi:hypothetical protein